tara:strand:+ start:183 stop:476 length:294 start_codon:yes stop_codon:yes gene_type:complete
MSDDNDGGLLEKALRNIENDRQRTSKLLSGLEEVLQFQPHDYKDLGTTAAKFVETLQRSNEQLVKIVAMLNKNTPQESRTLSKEEKEALYSDLEEQE